MAAVDLDVLAKVDTYPQTRACVSQLYRKFGSTGLWQPAKSHSRSGVTWATAPMHAGKGGRTQLVMQPNSGLGWEFRAAGTVGWKNQTLQSKEDSYITFLNIQCGIQQTTHIKMKH